MLTSKVELIPPPVTPSDIFQNLKLKLVGLFSPKRGKRDPRALASIFAKSFGVSVESGLRACGSLSQKGFFWQKRPTSFSFELCTELGKMWLEAVQDRLYDTCVKRDLHLWKETYICQNRPTKDTPCDMMYDKWVKKDLHVWKRNVKTRTKSRWKETYFHPFRGEHDVAAKECAAAQGGDVFITKLQMKPICLERDLYNCKETYWPCDGAEFHAAAKERAAAQGGD